MNQPNQDVFQRSAAKSNRTPKETTLEQTEKAIGIIA
jgi:hypothetical protein